MTTEAPVFPDGYSTVPRGKLANAVTCLQMLEAPAPRDSRVPADYSVERVRDPDLQFYRSLYRQVGEEWLWASRLVMSDDELRDVIHDPMVEVHVLRRGQQAVGLLELDFRQQAECEIVFFGIVREAMGRGAGRFLMDQGLSIAWQHPIERVWLHTCHFDSPTALPFYQRSGFTPYAFMVEVADDPRVAGVLSRSAAPHIPLLD